MSFNINIYILQIIYVTSQENKQQLLYFFTYCCLVLPIICKALVLRLGHATGGACVLMSTCCGSGLLRHGLNFSTAWCTMRLIGVE